MLRRKSQNHSSNAESSSFLVAAQAAGGKRRQAAARPAFLKKSSKKRLVVLTSARPGTLRPDSQKFFGSFFSKKHRFRPLVFAPAGISVLPGQSPLLKEISKGCCLSVAGFPSCSQFKYRSLLDSVLKYEHRCPSFEATYLAAGLVAVAVIALDTRGARADVAAEQATVAVLPPDDGYRLYIPDISFGHMADGHASVIDGHTFKFLGNLPIGFSGQVAGSADRSKVYVATTYYDRGNRGHRADVLEIYDARKLAFEREVVVPSKHVQGVPYNAYLVPSIHDRYVLLQNATPASSVTIVDPAAGMVVAELPTAGCFGIYPSPLDESVFSTLCGDGTAVTIGVDANGKERFRHRSVKFFDPVNDPVYIEAGKLGSKLVLLTFNGNVHILDVSGDTVVQNTLWSLIGPDGTKGWAPGGYQPFAVQARTGQIFVGMHANASEGSHKYPAQEIWQADLKTGRILRRMPASGAVALAVTQDEVPVLFVLNRDDATLQAFDVGAEFRARGSSTAVVDSPSTLKLP